MSMSQGLSLLQKKQAIQRGLSPYFQDLMLEQVLQYWEMEYGDKPTFVLNRFLSEICNTDELKNNRKDILRTLLSELSDEEKQLLEQPRISQQKSAALADDAQALTDHQLYSAFSMFVEQIVQTVESQHLQDFDGDIKGLLKEQKIQAAEVLLINHDGFNRQFLAEDYAKVLTTIYEVYCDFYGPSKADHIYARLKLKLKSQFPSVDLHRLL